MKKLLPLFLLTLFSLPAISADKSEEPKKTKSQIYEEKEFYYSSLDEFFRETFRKPITKGHVSKLEELLYYTGIELLEDYDPDLLSKYPSSSTRFILGRQNFQMKKYDKALELFNMMHAEHRFYPESRMLVAHIYAEKGNLEQSYKEVATCQSTAEKLEKDAINVKIKRYFRMIYEICLVNKARHLFKRGEYQAALDAYGKVPKNSYKWPYLLLEKAWVYYQMGDFNRVLGLLVTYKAPLLSTYFVPEAEYLAALAYFRLCLYDDAMTVIDQYYQFYRPRFAALDGVLKKNRNSQAYFYKLMFNPGEELKNNAEFVRQIITRMKKQTRFSLDFNTIHKINKEVKKVKAAGLSKKEEDYLLSHLGEVKTNMIAKINYNAKTDIFQFLETVPFFSSELFKLNLEIIAKKKDLVYANRQLISTRSRGDLSNVKRTRFEQFWIFKGEFWADELGDYSLGLQSNCQTIRAESEEDKKEEQSE
jgi:tetratricopeptide (TPR) repeat protein